MYKQKGLGLLWAEKKETSRRLMLRTARRVPDMQWLELYVRFPTCRHYLFGIKQMLTPNRLLFRWQHRMMIQYSVGANFVFIVTNCMATEQYSWNVDSQNLVTATIMVRVTVSNDFQFMTVQILIVIKSCNQGTATPDFLAHVCSRQTAGWINIPFSMDYGVTCRPTAHCVRWEPSSPIRGTAAP